MIERVSDAVAILITSVYTTGSVGDNTYGQTNEDAIPTMIPLLDGPLLEGTGSEDDRRWNLGLTDGGKQMRYMLLIYFEEQTLDETEREDCYLESAQLAHEIHSKGQYLAAAPLHPTSTATSVRVRDNKRLVTDGPFAETREQLGGYYLINANNLDEAIGIAARIPMARKGTVEIRPVIEIGGLPAD